MEYFNQNPQINKKINSMNNQLEAVNKELNLVENSTSSNDILSFSEHLKEFYLGLQKACIYARNFVFYEIPDPLILKNLSEKGTDKTDFLSELSKEELQKSEIKITKFDNDVIQFSVPIMTPFVYLKSLELYPSEVKKKAKKNVVIKNINRTDFLINILEKSIIQFLKENDLDRNKYKKSTLVFVNIFDSQHSKSYIPDTDNYSYKAYTDLITDYITGQGDGAFSLDFIYKSINGNKTRTEIYLIPQQFNSFIKNICSDTFSSDKAA